MAVDAGVKLYKYSRGNKSTPFQPVSHIVLLIQVKD